MGSDNSKGSRSLPQGQRAHPDIKSVSHRLGNDQEIRVKKIYHVSKPIERPPTPPPPEPVPVMLVQQPVPVQRLVQITRPAPQQIIQMAHPTVQQVVHVATPPRQIIHTVSPTVNEFRRPVILSQGNQDILRISRLE